MASKLNAKQLTEASKQIQKAAREDDPSSTLISLMQPLEGWKASEDLLRSTQIGITVGKLRMSKDTRVASMANKLITGWKTDVKKVGSPMSKGVSSGRSGTNSPAPAPKSAPAPKKFKADPEKRNTKEDGVDYNVTGDSTRDSCIKLMYDGLAFMSEEAPDDILTAARSVEQAAFASHGSDTSTAYKAKMRSLFQNLKMKPNKSLRKDVYSGKISPERFVKMTSDELKSEEQRLKDAALEKENMNKAMTAQEEKAISTTYVPCLTLLVSPSLPRLAQHMPWCHEQRVLLSGYHLQVQHWSSDRTERLLCTQPSLAQLRF